MIRLHFTPYLKLALWLGLFMFTSLQAQITSYYEDWRQEGGSISGVYSNTASSLDNLGNNYIAASVNNASGGISLSLKKYGSTGSLVWSKVFNTAATNKILVGNITVDAANNIYIAATVSSGNQVISDALTIKYSTSGVKLWHKIWNSPDNNYDGAAAISATPDGKIVVTGGAYRNTGMMNLLTICYTNQGTLLWSNQYDNSGLNEAGLKLFIENGYVTVTGISQITFNQWEYINQQIDISTGITTNAAITNLGTGAIDQVIDVVKGNDGSFYIAGSILTPTSGFDIKLIKLNPDFSISWTASYNGADNKDDFAKALTVRPNNTVFVTGYSTADDKDMVTLKFNANGSLAWQEIFNGRDDGADEGKDIEIDAAGNVYVTGYSSNLGSKDFQINVYDGDGNEVWVGDLNGDANLDDEGIKINLLPDGSFLIVGNSADINNEMGTLSAKYGKSTLILPYNYQEREVDAPFRENAGQLRDTDHEEVPDVRFYSSKGAPAPYFMDDRLSWVFIKNDTTYNIDTLWRMDWAFPQAVQRATKIIPLSEQLFFENYYLGHIPQGKARVRQYQYLSHVEAWPNTDILYQQSNRNITFQIIGKPGFDPQSLIWECTGATSLNINALNELEITTPLGAITLPAPNAWQEDSQGNIIPVSWQPAWVVQNNSFKLQLGTFNTGLPVFIQIGEVMEYSESFPCTNWSTYYGKESDESFSAIDIDQNLGDIYVTGQTDSDAFPTVSDDLTYINGEKDVVIGKFRYRGQRSWMIFFGGDVSPEASVFFEDIQDISYDIAADNHESVYIAGATNSLPTSFPLLNDGVGYYNEDILAPDCPFFGGMWVSRGYIAQFNKSNGIKTWCTFFGDSGAIEDEVTNIEISDDQRLIIGGYTGINYCSTSFPYIPHSTNTYDNPGGRLYVAELDANRQPVWFYPFGGLPSGEAPTLSSHCYLFDLEIDQEQNIFASGYLSGTNNFPFAGTNCYQDDSFNGETDGFIVKFNVEKELVWSTLLGGGGDDIVHGIEAKQDGGLYVTGFTSSNDYVQSYVNASYNDADSNLGGSGDMFVSKFNTSNQLTWSTYFGGNESDGFSNAYMKTAGGIMTSDSRNNLYITGKTFSADFPVINLLENNPEIPSIFDQLNKNINATASDAFVGIFNANDVLAYCTYWGGRHSEELLGIASFDGAGDIPPFIIFDGNSQGLTPENDPLTLIPLCQEDNSSNDPSYYQGDEPGEAYYLGNSEAFISKLYTNFDALSVNNREIGATPLTVYPNPAKDLLTLSLGNMNAGKLSIFNATGQEMFDKYIHNQMSCDIDISLFPGGIYFLVFAFDNQVYSQKFIKL